MTVFFYGIYNFTDAPFKPCADGYYCGKTGLQHTYEKYQAWKQWELMLIACWPFGMLASYALSKLRKPVA